MKKTWTRISALILSIAMVLCLTQTVTLAAAPASTATQSISTLSAADVTKLSKPDVEDPTNAANGVVVRWEKVKNAEGYYIYRKAGSETKWTKVKTVKGGSTLKWTDEKATTNGKKYVYTVKAYNGSVVSSYDKEGEETYFLSRPAAPTVKKSGAGFKASWKKNKKAGSYQIQYSTSSAFNDKTTKTVSDTTKTIKDLKGSTKYYVRVRSVKKVGDDKYYSAWSKAASVTTGKSSSSSASTGSSSSSKITAAEAKNIALKHAGFTSKQVTGLKAEKDRENGVDVYEVEFKKGGYEYNYEIAISNGKIRHWEKERDD